MHVTSSSSSYPEVMVQTTSAPLKWCIWPLASASISLSPFFFLFPGGLNHLLTCWSVFSFSRSAVCAELMCNYCPIGGSIRQNLLISSAKIVNRGGGLEMIYDKMGPILIVLTTRSYALTVDATGEANAVWPLKTAKWHLPRQWRLKLRHKTW